MALVKGDQLEQEQTIIHLQYDEVATEEKKWEDQIEWECHEILKNLLKIQLIKQTPACIVLTKQSDIS